jgi:transcriptional regulator with PAS, ATPase and Fis domain
MPGIKLNSDAEQVLVNYFWPGNIRQLKNIAEQISIIEKNREINADILLKYLPQYNSINVPSLARPEGYNSGSAFENNDKEIIFKVLRDTRTELNDLKKVVYDLVSAATGKINSINADDVKIINRIYNNGEVSNDKNLTFHTPAIQANSPTSQVIEVEETLSLQDKEIDMIKKALRKHKSKRKYAAKELGISERTLYRKINEYKIED